VKDFKTPLDDIDEAVMNARVALAAGDLQKLKYFVAMIENVACDLADEVSMAQRAAEEAAPE